MGLEIAFRQAVREDTGLILQFIRELAAYEKLLDQVETTKAVLEEWLFDKEKAEVLFITVDGKEAGYALYFDNFSTFLGRAGLYLEDLFVKPEFRGQGLGKALLARVAQTAIARGCGRVEWTCLNWNRPSINFYRSLGANPQSDWTLYRLAGDALKKLAAE